MKGRKVKKVRGFIIVCFSVLFMLLRVYPVLAYTQYDCSGGVHRYEAVIQKPAAEDADGLRVYTCELCGDTYEEVIPMYGHEYGEWETETEPSCTEPGIRKRLCIKHDHSEEQAEREEIPESDHKFAELEQTATCEDDGFIIYECTECGEQKEEFQAAVGHAYGEWIVDKEATATEEGHRYRVCLHDSSHIEGEDIEKMGAELNAADVLLVTGSAGAFGFFAVSIGHDVYILRWSKKRLKIKKRT